MIETWGRAGVAVGGRSRDAGASGRRAGVHSRPVSQHSRGPARKELAESRKGSQFRALSLPVAPPSFILVVGLSMMRDSEIHEISKVGWRGGISPLRSHRSGTSRGGDHFVSRTVHHCRDNVLEMLEHHPVRNPARGIPGVAPGIFTIAYAGARPSIAQASLTLLAATAEAS